MHPPEPVQMSPEVVIRAFVGALITLQAIGYLWLVWIFFSRNSAAFAGVIAIATYSVAAVNAIVFVVDLCVRKRAPTLVRTSMMLAAPALVAAVAAFVLL